MMIKTLFLTLTLSLTGAAFATEHPVTDAKQQSVQKKLRQGNAATSVMTLSERRPSQVQDVEVNTLAHRALPNTQH
ncbi:hypothetical protein [Alteromonas halophila]|uniref:DUF4148 domain-containing protein n=1 Tax=Alteromonas halophila TaxID=516698 RepID=A0A918MZL1_9ALTE|nr:hypothetical protein [Alteromonas halophila]GGW89578.1 hypothetical protein GCM10007391_24830 [Alteromonas halophila]